MAHPISNLQEKYLEALIKNLGEEKYEEFKQELRIPKDMPIFNLTKDDAYRLITKMIAESSPQDVEKALRFAIGKNTLPAKLQTKSYSPAGERLVQKD